MTEPERLPRFATAAFQLARIGRDFHSRGWALGTSGNFSAVVTREPLRLAITASGADKSALAVSHVIQVDVNGRGGGKSERGKMSAAASRPSSETPLHITIVRARRAGAVLHTHSIWSTLLSDVCATQGGLALEGYEMLKGLDGIATHEHREWVPVIDNSQEMETLGAEVGRILERHPAAHAFLLRRHGLYTWGR